MFKWELKYLKELFLLVHPEQERLCLLKHVQDKQEHHFSMFLGHNSLKCSLVWELLELDNFLQGPEQKHLQLFSLIRSMLLVKKDRLQETKKRIQL